MTSSHVSVALKNYSYGKVVLFEGFATLVMYKRKYLSLKNILSCYSTVSSLARKIGRLPILFVMQIWKVFTPCIE